MLGYKQNDKFKSLKPPTAESSKPRCSVCDCKLTASETAIDSHGMSATHLQKVKSLKKMSVYFTAMRLPYFDFQTSRLASLLVVPLENAFSGIPPSWCGRQLAGNS